MTDRVRKKVKTERRAGSTLTVDRKGQTQLQISSHAHYNELLSELDQLAAKGSDNHSAVDNKKIEALGIAISEYERSTYRIEAPTSLEGLIELRMYEMKLNQSKLAKLLNVSNAKLSLIMSGKQKPDVSFIKGVYSKLHIDGNALLELL